VAPGRELTPESRRRVASSPAPFPVIPRAQWLRLAADEADAALLRADARRNLLAVARVIGWSADKHTGRSRPTLARIMAATRLSRRCVQMWCRWLEAHGLLAVLEQGATPQYRPALYALGKGPQAREWRLSASPGDGTCTPPLVLDLDGSPTRARARDTGMDGRSAADSPAAPSPPRVAHFPLNQNPQRRSEALAAAEQLRRDLPVLRRMSVRAVRSAVREFFRAGWTVAEIERAWDVRPDGSRHIRTDAIRTPNRWVAWRLGLWRSADGTPLPPHSAELAAQADRHRAEHDARREQLAAVRAQVGDYPEQASQARAMLAAARAAKGRATGAAPPR
jgi:hypothetical protein